MNRADLDRSMDERALAQTFEEKKSKGGGFEGAGDLAALRAMQRKEKDVVQADERIGTESAQKLLLIQVDTEQQEERNYQFEWTL